VLVLPSERHVARSSRRDRRNQCAESVGEKRRHRRSCDTDASPKHQPAHEADEWTEGDFDVGVESARQGNAAACFRGAQDVESPGFEWTRIEAVVEGGKLTYYVNGKLVNAASDSSFKDGRIMIQSEGAEIYFRRIELQPLNRQ